jgi:hypothetical protein
MGDLERINKPVLGFTASPVPGINEFKRFYCPVTAQSVKISHDPEFAKIQKFRSQIGCEKFSSYPSSGFLIQGLCLGIPSAELKLCCRKIGLRLLFLIQG